MDRKAYLDRLLVHYGSTFDIYMPYRINGETYPAYARFFTHGEKYVLSREANMWKADCYEHVLFMESEVIDGGLIESAKRMISGYMEPELVRKGEKYPEPDHMYSYMTVVLIGQRFSEDKLIPQIERYRFDKGYKFHLRGYSVGRLIGVCCDSERVYLSRAVKPSRKMYKSVFKEVREGREGFSELCKKQGVTPFKQEYT